MVTLLLAFIYLAFISLGLPDSLLGAAWPILHGQLNVPISYMGMVTMTISLSTITASLFSERLTKTFGTWKVTTVSIFLTAVALIGFSTSSRFWMLILWAIPYGLGGGAIDAALNNYVAIHYNSRHMSWLHCFWGVGTILSPYIMGYCLTNASYHTGYQSVAALQGVIGILLLCSFPLWRTSPKLDNAQKEEKILGVRGVLRIKGAKLWLFGFLFYCAAESTVMHWASSYLVKARLFPEGQAASLAAMFFIGMTAGRFLSGFVADRVGDKGMIRIGTAIAFSGVVCLLLPVQSNVLPVAGLILMGLGCAPVYPCIMHATPNVFGEDKTQAIIGIQMGFAYMGSMLLSPFFGVLGQFVGMWLLPFYFGAATIAMILLLERTYKACK